MSTTHPVAWWFAPPHGLAPVETPTYPISAPCTVQGAARFRVVVGPWDDANAAESARQAVVARGYVDALLISGS